MPLFSGWTDLYTRRLYGRIEDCWNRPIGGAPTGEVDVLMRARRGWFCGDEPLALTGETRRCINLASYNYLGFGGVDSLVTPAVVEALREHGVSSCAARPEGGDTAVHRDLEAKVNAIYIHMAS